MDYLVILQLITILSVLVYGVNIGLSTGLANLSKKVISLICILYGGSVFLLGSFVSSYANIILEFISANSMFSNLTLAVLLIVAGILTIREWRLHDNNTIVSILLSTVVPYICFMISLMFLNSSLSSLMDLNSIKVKGVISLFLIIIILLTYFISKHSKISKKPYQIVLGNYMITLGAYYLVSTLISPNMMIMRSEKLAAITISSPIALLSVVFLVVVMIAIGVMLNREDNIYK
jgi:predicted transporter